MTRIEQIMAEKLNLTINDVEGNNVTTAERVSIIEDAIIELAELITEDA